MAAIGDLAHQFGTGMGEAAHQEKCCLDLLPFQKIEELWRVRRIRPIIEGERDLRGIKSMVERGTEKLRRRGNGAPGCYSCASSRSRRSIKRPRVHARILARGSFIRKSIYGPKWASRRDNVWL